MLKTRGLIKLYSVSSCYIERNLYRLKSIMAKGRPGGNPDITKFSFKQKYDWGESCTAKLTLRLPPSLNDKLKSIENWQEFARQAIAKAIEETES